MQTNEEVGIEAAIHIDTSSDDWAYYSAFVEAKRANWQRGNMKITECRASAIAVLRKHFVLRPPP